MESVDIMKLRMVIYMALNTVNGKVYIGKTSGLLGKRINAHKRQSKKRKWHFYNSIRKYGWDVFEWSVLEQCSTEEELNEMECHYIFQYKHYGKGVYNMTDGGDGMSGWVPSEETRRKIGESHKGWAPSEETRRKMSESRNSEEMRRKMSESRKGNKNSSKTWIVEYPDGHKIEINNMSNFCQQNNLDLGAMSNVASGKCKHHKGYKCWRIEDIPIPPPVPVYDHTAPLMEVFFGA